MNARRAVGRTFCEPGGSSSDHVGSQNERWVSVLVVVTDRLQAETSGRRLVDVVVAAVDGGARTVLLREKDLPRDARAKLAGELQAALRPVGGRLLVASDAELALDVGAVGVHLAGADQSPRSEGARFFERSRPSPGHERSQNEPTGVGPQRLRVGRSCHSLAELRDAQEEGVDYATLSPIWVTESKPGYGPALGREVLATACAEVSELPVYALGGVGPDQVAACREAGAAGVAVMGEVMRADDPATLVRTMLEEWT